MTRMRPVHADTLQSTVLARASTEQPFQLYLTFSRVHGPAPRPGREAVAQLRLIELAGALQALPASLVPDLADRQAVIRVRELLRRLDDVRRLGVELEAEQ